MYIVVHYEHYQDTLSLFIYLFYLFVGRQLVFSTHIYWSTKLNVSECYATETADGLH